MRRWSPRPGTRGRPQNTYCTVGARERGGCEQAMILIVSRRCRTVLCSYSAPASLAGRVFLTRTFANSLRKGDSGGQVAAGLTPSSCLRPGSEQPRERQESGRMAWGLGAATGGRAASLGMGRGGLGSETVKTDPFAPGSLLMHKMKHIVRKTSVAKLLNIFQNKG